MLSDQFPSLLDELTNYGALTFRRRTTRAVGRAALPMPDHLTTCEHAARAAGNVLMQWRRKTHAREKAPADLVTEADFAAQETVFRLLKAAFPDYRFVGEEAGEYDLPPVGGRIDDEEYVWFVDPLDGTLNYVHGLPGWCVSVALAHRGRVVAGCVFDPQDERCFLTARGEGAYLNGERLQTSGVNSLDSSLVAVSLPAKVGRKSKEILALLEVISEVQGFRRMGSAALNLCYVAAGNLDAYWASSVQVWDVAAGSLLVEEAGGVVSALDGGQFNLETPTLAAACTPEVQRELVGQLSRVFGP